MNIKNPLIMIFLYFSDELEILTSKYPVNPWYFPSFQILSEGFQGPRRLASLVRRLPCGLRVLDQIHWWDAAREFSTAGKWPGTREAGHQNPLEQGWGVTTMVVYGGYPLVN